MERRGADNVGAAETRICLNGLSRTVHWAVGRPVARTRVRHTPVLAADALRGEVHSQPQDQSECGSADDTGVPILGHGPVSIAHRACRPSFRHVPARRHGFLTAFTTMRISAARGALVCRSPVLDAHAVVLMDQVGHYCRPPLGRQAARDRAGAFADDLRR